MRGKIRLDSVKVSDPKHECFELMLQSGFCRVLLAAPLGSVDTLFPLRAEN